MNRKQYALIVTLALIAGLIGGIISTRFIWHLKEIRAESFTIVDKWGKNRGHFGFIDEWEYHNFPVMELRDSDGNPGLWLYVDTDGIPSIVFYGEGGDTLPLTLGLHEDGSPHLYLRGKNGRSHISLDIMEDQARIRLSDKSGKRTLATPLFEQEDRDNPSEGFAD